MQNSALTSSYTLPCPSQCRRLSSAPAPASARLTAAPQLRLESRRSSATVSCSAATVVEEGSSSAGTQFANLGPDLWNTTYYPTGEDASTVKKPWYLVDAEGQTLGRLATLVANHIRGKTVAQYHPSMDTGSYVVVVNAEKILVSGNKFQQKMYRRHTGRPGSLKEESFRQLQARIPQRILEKAIRGMLPSGRIGNSLFTHLKVYKGPAHPHSAQRPEDITYKIGKKPSEALTAPSS